jgi:hypothetical protein
MGGARSTYVGEVRTWFWWEDPRERDHLEELGIDGWIILKCVLKKLDGYVDWIDLAVDRDRWRGIS